MAHDDIRTDGRPVPLSHHSARGHVQRNSNNFTRGSQLITHETLMWFSGARLPVIVWFFTFLITWSVVMSILLDEHGFQLVVMKLYALGWKAFGADPMSRVNVTLPSGKIYPTFMGAVPFLPDVQRAWAVAVRGLFGSLFISLFLVVPASIWFVDISRRRGKTILEERHERGAMLVDAALLHAGIAAHNRARFEEEVRALDPALSVRQVLKLPFAERKALGIHHAYTLAGIPWPHRLEQSHAMLVGTTGAGKTTQLRDLIAQMRERQDSAVVFDLTGAYVEAFYDPGRDTILNPLDKRCPAWSVFNDCSSYSHFIAAAAALIPSNGGSSEPFWALAARTLFVEMCVRLQERGQGSNLALAENLMTADLKKVHRFLTNTIADPITAPEAARMAESIRAVFNTNAQILRFLPDDGELFSIRQWMTHEKKPGSILFVTSSYDDLEMLKPLLTLWMDLAINSLMTMKRTRDLRTWFLFDELGALHRLPAIEKGLQTARNFGGAIVLGLHSFEKLIEVYGEQGARNLASLARTKLILATSDPDTAEQCARYIGNREVRQMDEAYSYGYNNTRDASTLTPRKQIEPLVIADDISNLPNLHGFIKFPEGFPAAKIVLTYKHYPAVADGFDPRADVRPVRARRADEIFAERGSEGAEGTTEAGGREAAADLVQEPLDVEGMAKDFAAYLRSAEAGFGEEEAARLEEHRADVRHDEHGHHGHGEAASSSVRQGRDDRDGVDRTQDLHRGRDDRHDGPGGARHVRRTPEIEDQTLAELRQDFPAGIDGDGMDFGI